MSKEALAATLHHTSPTVHVSSKTEKANLDALTSGALGADAVRPRRQLSTLLLNDVAEILFEIGKDLRAASQEPDHFWNKELMMLENEIEVCRPKIVSDFISQKSS